MKKLLAIVFLALVLYGIWWWFFKDSTHQSAPKVEALKVGHHSNQFNQSITNAVSSYLDIKAAFVEADSVKAKTMGVKFIGMIDSLKLDDLKKDTTGILSSAQAQMSDIKINRALDEPLTIECTSKSLCYMVQSGNKTYSVTHTQINKDSEDLFTCTCPDFQFRQTKCKHILSTELYKKRTICPYGTNCYIVNKFHKLEYKHI